MRCDGQIQGCNLLLWRSLLARWETSSRKREAELEMRSVKGEEEERKGTGVQKGNKLEKTEGRRDLGFVEFFSFTTIKFMSE